MTLTKAIMTDVLFNRVGLSKREAKDIVEGLFFEIRDVLSRGEHVKIARFGRFEVRDKKQRPGRNPKTGQPVPVTARRVVIFYASMHLKGRLVNLKHGIR